jgi:hypothetical protein
LLIGLDPQAATSTSKIYPILISAAFSPTGCQVHAKPADQIIVLLNERMAGSTRTRRRGNESRLH